MRINGKIHYLWRAVDHEGEVLESYVTRRRDTAAALSFLRKAMRRYGLSETPFTDGHRSCGAAVKDIGNAAFRVCTKFMAVRLDAYRFPQPV